MGDFKKLLLVSSQHKLISKCVNFQATPYNPINKGLKFSPRNQLLQVGQKQIFIISL